MNKIIMLITTYLLIQYFAIAQNPPNDNNWSLMWEDDFVTQGLNSRWTKEVRPYDDLPCFSYSAASENIFISNESLVIKVVNKGNNKYTSGSIKDYNRISGVSDQYLYGYFEIECKLPSGRGMFPAFWLHGCTWNDELGSCLEYREIDVFEHGWDLYPTPPHSNGDKDPYRHTSGFYWRYPNSTVVPPIPCGCTQGPENYHNVTQNLFTNYNKFGVEWSPKTLIYTFNEEAYKFYYNNSLIPNKIMSIIADLRLPLDTATCKPIPDLSSPATHEFRIKNIKHYKLKCDCEQNVQITTNSQLNNYIHSVKKNIYIGGSNLKVAPNTKIGLRATNEITIEGDFEVLLGSEFYAITHGCPDSQKTIKKDNSTD